MPNTASAKKRLRQAVVRRERNRAAKSQIRTQVKKVLAAVSEGDHEKADAEFRVAAKWLDRAGARGVIHRNAASRRKARLQAHMKAAKQA